MLFAATTINYIDRQVFGILAPTLQRGFGWTETQYGDIVSWFSLVYAIGFLATGRWLDRIGVRRGFAFAAAGWSLAAIGHAVARTAVGFSAVRALLGLAESANFPGAIKAIAEWFPKTERALATGIFNAGANTGAIVASILVPWVALDWGWQGAFVITGALGFVWLVFWLVLYRSPGEYLRTTPDVQALARCQLSVTSPEIGIHVAEIEVRVKWLQLLRCPQTWAFAAAKLLTDPVWWFYLYWLPKFLDARFSVNLARLAVPLIIVYVVAGGGSIYGGWLSSTLIARGVIVDRARKISMVVMALVIIPTAFAPFGANLWTTVLIVAVAAGAHQGWEANLYTLVSDMFPRAAVASVVGMGGFAGAMGGVIFQRVAGRVLNANGNNYAPIFIFCALAYITSWCFIHWLVPRLNSIKTD